MLYNKAIKILNKIKMKSMKNAVNKGFRPDKFIEK
jgi:hypothetical protein